MVNKPLIRPYFLGGGVALGGAARIPLNVDYIYCVFINYTVTRYSSQIYILHSTVHTMWGKD